MAGPADGWALAWRFARRELRGGLRGFRIFLACLMLGVFAIAAVGSVSSALVAGLDHEGQTILGGDADVAVIHRQASPAEFAFIGKDNQVAVTAQMRSMARTEDSSRQSLVELKAVDGAYPLYGAVELAPAQPLARALEQRNGRWGAVAESTLIQRLGLKIGDNVRVGIENFELRGEIVHEPDRVGDGFAIGPRVMIADGALEATGLIVPGSLVTYHYKVKRPANERSAASLKEWTQSLDEAFPDAGWRVQDRTNSAQGVRSFVSRVALFLSFVGLTALLVGGVGVANAVKSYIDGKRETIATLKCLGATGDLVFCIYLMQVMVLAGLGTLGGLVLGALVPFVMKEVAGTLLPIPVSFGLYPAPLVVAAAYGLLTALAFAIWPVARARDIPAASLFRELVAPDRRWPRPAYAAAAGLSLLALALLAIATADRPLFALWFVLGAAGVFLLLRLAATAVMALAARVPRLRRPELRLALANLHRPGAPTVAVMLSLGLGLTLLVTVSLIDRNLTAEIAKDLPARAPSFFFVDIQRNQADQFAALVAKQPGVSAFERVPMLRGRIVSVKGQSAADMKVASDAQWALKGDRGMTFSATLPRGSTLAQGKWWPADYKGPLLVSMTKDIAKGFGAGIGDSITVNVLGRDLTATIANTRDVDWTSLGINFVLVFSPGALEGAPYSELATVTMEPQGEQALETVIARTFPNVTSIRVKEALDAANGLLGNFTLAIRTTSIVTLVAGVLVLAGAIGASFRARAREAVLLKVLGATRARVLAIQAAEFALLGLCTALVAALAGSLASYLVVVEVMGLKWSMPWAVLGFTLVGSVLATVALGLAGSFRILSVPPARILRQD
ncbi:MAG: ABC transporter permease [Parvibaculaceae bacterium]|nr:ABC transporter permease [Parvibaculaceae bacterium]